MSTDQLRQQAQDFNEAIQAYAPPTSEEIGAFFNRNHDVLVEIHSGNIHHGYWTGPDDASGFEEASTRLTGIVIDKLAVKPGERVLDLGCGSGRPALQLVRATGAQVVGISISTEDVAKANANAAAEGLTDQATFQHANALDLPFPPDSFDAVLVLSTMLHVANRTRVLKQIARVLRPAGRVILTDTVSIGPDVVDEEELYVNAAVAAAWCTVLPARKEEYPEFVRTAGLEIEEISDISEHTKYTYSKVYAALREYSQEHDDLPPDMAEILEIGDGSDEDEDDSTEQTEATIIVVAHRPS